MADSGDLRGWVPVSARVDQGRLWTEMCLLEGQRFTEPFFEDTIGARMREPFHVVFRRRIHAEALAEWVQSNPGLPVSGFIFHMSRCGSTLVSQVLAASAAHRVISEAGPIDAALRAGPPGSIDAGIRVRWLRAMIGMFAQAGSDTERKLFVKFDSWHASFLPLLLRAFPGVPWIFMTRDPVEVIVSHLRRPGAQMVPGMVGYMPPGIDPQRSWQVPREEYCARVLGAICSAACRALDLGPPGQARVVDYGSLPNALDQVVFPHFGVQPDASSRSAMDAAMRRDAKNPGFVFVPDRDGKQKEASEAVREAAQRWVADAWKRLLERAAPVETSASYSDGPRAGAKVAI